MNELEVQEKQLRQKIVNLEKTISSFPEDQVFYGDTENAPVTSSFVDGIYIREIKIPKGLLLIGKIHLKESVSFMLKGKMIIVDEEKGSRIIEAPQMVVSKPGVKRAVYALEDVVFTNIHANPTNETDLVKIEEKNIVSTFKEFDKFLENNNKLIKQ